MCSKVHLLKHELETAKRGIGGSGLLSWAKRDACYRGISLIENTHPHRITIGPQAYGLGRVLRGGGVLVSEVPL